MNGVNRLKFAHGLLICGAAVVVPVLTNGCSAASQIQNTLCCKEYAAGTDMTNVNFGVKADVAGQFNSFAQAAGDLTVVAGAAVSDATSACQAIAHDANVDPNDPTGATLDANAMGKTGTDLMNYWCGKAQANISASLTFTGVAAAMIKVTPQGAQCSVSLDAQASCQGHCDVSGMCDIKANPPVCTGGKLDIDCKGECDVSATAPTIDCTGSCMGMCSGSCSATGGVYLSCNGQCSGTCAANAQGTGNGTQADGSCQGFCNAKCTASATAPAVMCMGTCSGSCNAACTTMPGQASVQCSGTCKADYTPISCTGGTLSGGCMVNADCQANCNASATAKANCTPPSLTITITGTAKAGTEAQFTALVNTIQTNVPKLYLIANTRVKAFGDLITKVGTSGSDLVANAEITSDAHADACIVYMVADVANASANFSAAASAGGMVTSMLGM